MQKRLLWHVLCGLLGVLLALPVVAQNFPEKPITLVVPYSADGATDVAMRALAEAAAKHLGQRIIVENRTGAAGTLGPSTMVNARPDGYLIGNGNLVRQVGLDTQDSVNPGFTGAVVFTATARRRLTESSTTTRSRLPRWE